MLKEGLECILMVESLPSMHKAWVPSSALQKNSEWVFSATLYLYGVLHREAISNS
jgi:hypothetical protein